jgi:hypothetical protein
MKKQTVPIVILLALIVSGIVFLVSRAPKGNSQSMNSNVSGTAGVKLADEPYAPYVYLVDPNNLSSKAKQALTGFNVTADTLSNGDTKINLAAINPEYRSQSYELKPGQKFYFIESSFGDDSDNHESNPRDDSGVVVDQNGYVVQ